MQQGWRKLLGSSLSLLSQRLLLSMPGCGRTLLRRLFSSPKPRQERQLAEESIWDQQSFVFCTASHSRLPPAPETPLLCSHWAGKAAGPGPGLGPGPRKSLDQGQEKARTRTRTRAKARSPGEWPSEGAFASHSVLLGSTTRRTVPVNNSPSRQPYEWYWYSEVLQDNCGVFCCCSLFCFAFTAVGCSMRGGKKPFRRLQAFSTRRCLLWGTACLWTVLQEPLIVVNNHRIIWNL